jgi:membrane-associated phospholipid phosphatase
MISWLTITRLAGITVTAPIALGVAAFLALEGERRLAVLWCLLFTAGLALVVATKMAFIGWGIGIHPLDFTGASGHAMRAIALAPVVLYLVLQHAPHHLRMAGVLAGYAFGILIGISRVVLHAHTESEVVAGWLVGAVVSVAFICIASSLQKTVFTPTRIAGGMVALFLLAAFGRPFPTQYWLTKASLYISGHDKPFVRAGSKPVQTKTIGKREWQ